MTEHLSTEILERFQQQTLAAGERGLLYSHLFRCEQCRKRIDPHVETMALAALLRQLTDNSVEESCHLEFRTIEGYLDGSLDEVGRDVVEMHLKGCVECAWEVSDVLESLKFMKTDPARTDNKVTLTRNWFPAITHRFALPGTLQVSIVIVLASVALISTVLIWKLTSGRPNQPSAVEKHIWASASPSPSQSPFISQPAISSSPKPGPSPHRTIDQPPRKKASGPGQEMLVLNDGPNKIVLDNVGKLSGLESLSKQTQQTVRETLTTKTIKRPEVLDELGSAEVTLRSPEGPNQSASIVYPANIVIAEDKPMFEWTILPNVAGYRVEIRDASFHQVKNSENLSPSTRFWIPSEPLKRRVVYMWIVRMLDEKGESVSITAPRKFKILEDEKMKELTLIKNTSKSHLALGVFYAREGMISEAQREFEALAKDNPNSTLTTKLLKEIHSWLNR
jgi:hypothetical protein